MLFKKFVLLILNNIPKAKKVIQIDVPPVLINGKGCPVTGNKCTATPIFIKAWKTIGNPTASDSNWPKILLDLYEMITILNSNIIYNSNIIIAWNQVLRLNFYEKKLLFIQWAN